jgi:hypothetical protein
MRPIDLSLANIDNVVVLIELWSIKLGFHS